MPCKIFLKQLKNRNNAHALEHAVFKAMQIEFLKQGLLNRLDYDIDARVNDNIIVLECEALEKDTLKKIENFLKTYQPQLPEVKRSLDEINIEYGLEYTWKQEEAMEALKNASRQPWLTYDDDFLTRIPIKKDWAMKDELFWFKKSKPIKYDDIKIKYLFEAPADNLGLKVLAVYVLYRLGPLQIDKFYLNPKIKATYDRGDHWWHYPYEEDEKLIEYSHILEFFATEKITPQKVKKLFYSQLEELKALGLVDKLQKFIDYELKGDYQMMSSHNMFKATGLYIGNKTLSELNTPENIEKILNTVKIDFSVID